MKLADSGLAQPARRVPALIQIARARGQALVEAALVLPFVVVLSVGVADLGRAFYYSEAVNNAARQALRTAISQPQQSTGDAVCSGGGASASNTATIPPASGNLVTIGNEAALESTSNGTPASSALNGASMTVTWHCASNKALTGATASSTDPLNTGSAAIEVQLSYSMTILTPFLSAYLHSPVVIKTDIVGRAQY
jgi:Flp pilus assembly protein TadG